MTLPAFSAGSLGSNEQQVHVAVVKILHLADISSSDELMSKITEFTEPRISRGVSILTDDDLQMAEKALSVLSRIAGQIGEQGSG
ncbi:hypothetical protein E2562_010697 [Oryza meyeriana var. granulata]|uniref:Uncharacterized protein n=1 Tax=Oryza meyeriana var. granulata TaxID=110450 RepID=A0A6G1EWA3_9ORYZ|nr:hypothetical protein E2562_010697 [Oryza meyeriana var. granulata]